MKKKFAVFQLLLSTFCLLLPVLALCSGRDYSGPQSSDENSPASPTPVIKLFQSTDRSRIVKIFEPNDDAFLFDGTKAQAFQPIFLASEVSNVEYSITPYGHFLKIKLVMRDGSFKVFDDQGRLTDYGNNSEDSDGSKSSSGGLDFHFRDSSGNDFVYYPAGYLFLQEKDMVGEYIGGSFTTIKRIDKNKWLVEASEPDMPTTKTFCLKIPRAWDAQTIIQSPGGFDAKIISHTDMPAFEALSCQNLIVFVTSKFVKLTNELDGEVKQVRVLELKAIAAQPCS